MKKHLTIVFIIFVLLSCSSCVLNQPEQRVVGASLSCHAIPGAYINDGNLIKAKKYDEDSQGRMLIGVHIGDGFGIDAIAISQKNENGKVYYYDSICYKIIDDYSDCNLEIMEKLKRDNDWGLPFDKDKCINRPLNNEYTLVPSDFYNVDIVEGTGETAKNGVYLPKGSKMMIKLVDKSTSGQAIYIAAILTDNGTKEYYLMIANADGTYDPETQLLKIDDIHNSNETLARIKEQNGWEG